MIIEQYTDAAGYIRIVWQMADGNALTLKYKEQPTTAQLEAEEARYVEQHEMDSVQQIKIDLMDSIELLKEVVLKIRNTPNLTLTQYNNYLTTQTWYDAATIRYFIYRLALGLASHYDVTLTGYTEAQVLTKVRDWIVNTPLKKIAKVIYGTIG